MPAFPGNHCCRKKSVKSKCLLDLKGRLDEYVVVCKYGFVINEHLILFITESSAKLATYKVYHRGLSCFNPISYTVNSSTELLVLNQRQGY